MERSRVRLFVVGTSGGILLALILGMAGGILLDRQVLSHENPSVGVPPGAEDDFALLAQTWTLIDENYVEQAAVDPRGMAYSAIHGMVRTLGDAGHTRFLPPELADRHADQIKGQFEGIGVYVEVKEGRLVVVAPIDDTPAQRAGLEPGDIIVEVDGKDVGELSLDQVVSRILGPAGTRVTLTVIDAETDHARTLELERAEIDLDLVTWQQLPGTSTAYLRISTFADGATQDLIQTLGEIEKQGASGLILDLRNNPGGLLGEAVGVASQFVPTGTLLLRRDADGTIARESVREDAEAVGIPMVALANGGTASAAEIVIGALQDHGRASVVGSQTFGAGTVLNEFPLPDGSVLLLAVEEWLTPDGHVIWQKGLDPNIAVPLPADAEPLNLFTLRGMTGAELQNSQDAQLLRALELVQDAARR